jgi:hypothetical protein
LLTDGVNDKEIQSRLPSGVSNEKSIGKLERWLRQEGYEYVDRDIKLLRDVQTLRSKVTAHRKGSDYEQSLLERANLFLEGMREWRLDGE